MKPEKTLLKALAAAATLLTAGCTHMTVVSERPAPASLLVSHTPKDYPIEQPGPILLTNSGVAIYTTQQDYVRFRNVLTTIPKEPDMMDDQPVFLITGDDERFVDQIVRLVSKDVQDAENATKFDLKDHTKKEIVTAFVNFLRNIQVPEDRIKKLKEVNDGTIFYTAALAIVKYHFDMENGANTTLDTGASHIIFVSTYFDEKKNVYGFFNNFSPYLDNPDRPNETLNGELNFTLLHEFGHNRKHPNEGFVEGENFAQARALIVCRKYDDLCGSQPIVDRRWQESVLRTVLGRASDKHKYLYLPEDGHMEKGITWKDKFGGYVADINAQNIVRAIQGLILSRLMPTKICPDRVAAAFEECVIGELQGDPAQTARVVETLNAEDAFGKLFNDETDLNGYRRIATNLMTNFSAAFDGMIEETRVSQRPIDVRPLPVITVANSRQ